MHQRSPVIPGIDGERLGVEERAHLVAKIDPEVGEPMKLPPKIRLIIQEQCQIAIRVCVSLAAGT